MAKEAVRLVRPLRNGQITIPREFRVKLEIDERTLLQIALVEGELRIRPVRVAARTANAQWARELYDLFAPVRKAAAKSTEAQVNRDIHKAIAGVRKKRAARRA